MTTAQPTTTTTTTPSRYCAKEYHGDRPCLDALTMAELRLRCADRNRGNPPAGYLGRLRGFLKELAR